MKRTRSDLIEAFLFNVNNGDISGPPILQRVVDALQKILDGEKPDTALKIERGPGGQSQDRNFIVAYIIRDLRKKGEKVAVAHFYANKWLKEDGHKALSDKRLRDIYNQHKPKLVQIESIKLMVEKTGQHSRKTE